MQARQTQRCLQPGAGGGTSLHSSLGAEYNAGVRRIVEFVLGWGPALVIMLVIFVLSAQRGSDLPDFGSLDYVLKKAGHFLGYGMLSLAYWRGLKLDERRRWLAWLLALLYALTDEFHQLFVADRHSSLLDVVLFDGTGAAAGLGLGWRLWSPR